ncbi:MAG: alpha-1,2-fucosyltransferase [bacterium]
MNKKTIIILETAPGARLANQLWNFISVYAYCLEKGYKCYNYCFFEEKKHSSGKITLCDYNQFFNFPDINKFVKFLAFLQLKKNKLLRKIKPYGVYKYLIKKLYPNSILDSFGDIPFYLAPTKNNNPNQSKSLTDLEKKSFNAIYLRGWLFRNPEGIKKFHPEIKKYFKPRNEIAERVNNFMQLSRKNYKEIVGVHIRQNDYKIYEQGKYFFSQNEVRNFLEDYIKFFKKNRDEILFVICSDGLINTAYFKGLNVKISFEGAIDDLFILSLCDIIIGSDSTFSAFAAYYGDIPIAIFSRPRINWNNFNATKKFNYANASILVRQ